MSSDQDSWDPSLLKTKRISATAAGFPGEEGYRELPTIRKTPFSVIGQVAHAFLPLAANH